VVATRPQTDGRAARVLVAVAVVAVVAIDALYLAIVVNQGGPQADTTWVAPFVAGYLGLVAAMLLISLVAGDPLAVGLRGGASGGLLVLGVLALFSIGFAILIAAVVCIAATVVTLSRRPATRSIFAAAAGLVLTIAVLVVGFQIAWQQISCPATGESGGTTASWTGSGQSYMCSNGHLTVSR
jgi:hypothetical protein